MLFRGYFEVAVSILFFRPAWPALSEDGSITNLGLRSGVDPGLVLLGEPLTATQPIQQFFSRPDFWGGPSDFFPPGNPSVEVGGEAPPPPPQWMGFRRGEAV